MFNLDTSMNINFEDHILDLLKHNDCVVLPNFGGFILKSIPSTIHQHTISPPSKQIAFNSSLKHDDELLTGAIMGKHSLPYETAKNKVLAFSNQISFGIKKDASFKLNKIGSFSVNENNQIIFKPFVLELSDSSFYGMRKFHLKPIPKQLIKPSVKKIEILVGIFLCCPSYRCVFGLLDIIVRIHVIITVHIILVVRLALCATVMEEV